MYILQNMRKFSHLLVCMHLNHKYIHIVWAHNNTESIVYLGQKTKMCKEKSLRQNSINTFEKWSHMQFISVSRCPNSKSSEGFRLQEKAVGKSLVERQ